VALGEDAESRRVWKCQVSDISILEGQNPS
jgi:hypothetical protein